MGMYLNFASLTFHKRARRSNVVPITIGPHGSNFGDVISALKCLRALDVGLEVEIFLG